MIKHTLTAQELSNIHNGKCELHFAIGQLEKILSEKYLQSLKKAFELLDAGMKSVYQEEERQLKERNRITEKLSQENGFHSCWSIDEATDFSGIPFPEARSMVYKNHWGKNPVNVTLPQNASWLDLWKAADALIKMSGDNHHIFIENFTVTDENSFILELSTGS